MDGLSGTEPKQPLEQEGLAGSADESSNQAVQNENTEGQVAPSQNTRATAELASDVAATTLEDSSREAESRGGQASYVDHLSASGQLPGFADMVSTPTAAERRYSELGQPLAAVAPDSPAGHSEGSAASLSGTKSTKGATVRRVGTEVVSQVKLPQWQLDETADRLSKPKEHKETSNQRVKAVQLKYEYDKTLRGGKGGYKETLVPAKSVTSQEKQDYMVQLAERCKETREKTKQTLREKYLQPLIPNAKKIAPGEEMEQHMQRIDRLYHGQGVNG